MGVSIRSIAEELGLSKATVSWILAGKGEEKGFSIATISQVKKYAKKVGYRPNLIARSLSTGYTKTVGLVIPSIGDPFYSQLAQGVEARVSDSGYVMILGSSEGDAQKERQLVQTMRDQQVAGLIVAPTNKSDTVIGDMLKDKFPFVLVDRYIPGLPSNYVISDNEESSYDLVSHLCGRGCKKIAAVTTDTHLFTMEMRIMGYRRALLENKCNPEDIHVVEVNRSNYVEDITKKLDSLLSCNPDIDGLFFTTHYLAEEAIRYFVSENIDYNSRFKMAVMHSTKALEILAPDMSKALIPIERMGAIAVDILFKNIASADNFSPQELILKNTRF